MNSRNMLRKSTIFTSTIKRNAVKLPSISGNNISNTINNKICEYEIDRPK